MRQLVIETDLEDALNVAPRLVDAVRKGGHGIRALHLEAAEGGGHRLRLVVDVVERRRGQYLANLVAAICQQTGEGDVRRSWQDGPSGLH